MLGKHCNALEVSDCCNASEVSQCFGSVAMLQKHCNALEASQCFGSVAMLWKCCNALEVLQCFGSTAMLWKRCNTLEAYQCFGSRLINWGFSIFGSLKYLAHYYWLSCPKIKHIFWKRFSTKIESFWMLVFFFLKLHQKIPLLFSAQAHLFRC